MIIESKSEELTALPSSYDEENIAILAETSTHPLTDGFGGSDSTEYAQWTMITGTGAESYVFYKFDLSQIPETATIDGVSCLAKGYISTISTSYIANREMQLFCEGVAKGAATNITTSATAQNIDAGQWTREELADCQIRIYGKRGTSSTATSRTMRFYGATLTVGYTWENIHYEITARASTGGAISPASINIEAGESASFTINADRGYELADFLDNNETAFDKVVANTYTLFNVQADHTLEAIFDTYCDEIFSQLITNRTQRAFYNASDLNRIGKAINCLAKKMSAIGYSADIEMPINWNMNSIYFARDGDVLLAALRTIKRQLASNKVLFVVPNSMNGLNYVQANEIENMLALVNELIETIRSAYLQCGVEQTGGVLI